MSVRAKFRCMEIAKVYSRTDERGVDVFHYNVRLLPVLYGKKGSYGVPENAVFYAATPSGEIVMQVVADLAASQFRPGKSYFVDFTEADD